MNKQMIGACGEFYVASLFSGHEFSVALPRAGAKSVDLFVVNPTTVNTIQIQVKTGTDSKRKNGGVYFYEWQMSRPAIEFCNDSTWYVFVWLNQWPQSPIPPEVFIIPSLKVLATIIEKDGDKQPSWPSFWMLEEEIAQFRNEKGIELIRQAMLMP